MNRLVVNVRTGVYHRPRCAHAERLELPVEVSAGTIRLWVAQERRVSPCVACRPTLEEDEPEGAALVEPEDWEI